MKQSTASSAWAPPVVDLSSTDEVPHSRDWVLDEATEDGRAACGHDTIPSPPPESDEELGPTTIPSPPPLGDFGTDEP